MGVTKILINNGNLGRMGKTTIAYTIYKQSKIPFKYVTNDIENASIELEEFVGKGDLLYFPDGTEIDINPQDNIIFDFGGKPDDRLLTVAEYVDLIIVPIAFQSSSELTLTIKNINALAERNSNILIVINNCKPKDGEMVKLALKAICKYKILELSFSEFIRRLANDNQTVFEVAEENRTGAKKQLNKKIIPQFKAIFDHLDLEIND